MGKFKKMMKHSYLLERVDYMDTAKELVNQYGLKSKIKMGTGKNFGEYIPETDTVPKELKTAVPEATVGKAGKAPTGALNLYHVFTIAGGAAANTSTA